MPRARLGIPCVFLDRARQYVRRSIWKLLLRHFFLSSSSYSSDFLDDEHLIEIKYGTLYKYLSFNRYVYEAIAEETVLIFN